ncbi:hypothetical protein KKB64_03020 [Patescibacteria group bacterium]|nr:hypothetical protein [Patescibacteria group bacterium]MBU1472730.1 hypothetical protein [Patescibacteria group bacterium]MBU2459997.1 hypothetical protein [Patescibacteria group bacterium]MBU2544345.1 hypothetical protein [Patescibacteria group bacterium]
MKSHAIHFAVLVGILVIGISAFLYAYGDRSMQLTVGILTSLAYLAWGIIHHALEKDLHWRIVLEYVLIAAIAVVLLMTIIS